MQAVPTLDNKANRLERVAHNRTSLWVALVMALVGLAAFVVLFNLLPDLGTDVSEVTLITLGLVFSLVPAALWLGFFYRLDRLEPEPKHMVLTIFGLGLLLSAALHGPVLDGIFTINEWLFTSWWSRLLGGILVIGFFEQFLIFLAVRIGVFDHPEFDERVDGVIYAMAAGLGLATLLNFRYVLDSGGVDLDIGSIRMVINALAFASFAGIQGYFIGQTRFEQTPIYYLPSGMAMSATLNGLFFFVLEQTGGGLSHNPWRELIIAAIVAVLTLFLVFWLIARANEETLRLARQAESAAAPAPSLPVAPTSVGGAE